MILRRTNSFHPTDAYLGIHLLDTKQLSARWRGRGTGRPVSLLYTISYNLEALSLAFGPLLDAVWVWALSIR